MKPFVLLFAVGLVFVVAGGSSGQMFCRGRPQTQGVSSQASAAVARPSPEALKLVELVRAQQQLFVRPSYSETNCFTWIDLGQLKPLLEDEETIKAIRADPAFAAVVQAIKPLSAAQRTAAYNAALGVWRLTWREMGFIDPSGNGQTEAGQQGDQFVGQKVVALVRQALRE